ncbi:AraC family transcriptional regulator [Flagellimonas sp. CMM7]|uniref:helix-turn-helix domain-containing protein n=1 Tax=Flagellimonas sp. CMM7 TaxID=2654676 RepID=UPI0013CFE5B2|nr:helix-turn-helix domain-containing protein [Flagellimonas sp. CMM7]UII80963.1 helix-turn-helix domain-containing protein [Flagellimonas sp. CMM7]
MASDYMLIVTIILIAGIFISDLWVRQGGLTKPNFILEKLVSFYVLPSFLAYSMLLISNDNKLKMKWWWFASFAIAFSVFIFIDFTFLTDYDIEKLRAQHRTPSTIYQFFYRGGNVFVFVALIWFFKKLKQYQQRIRNDYSFIETIKLTWLVNFAWIYFINNLLVLLISSAFSFWHLGSLELLYIIVYASIVLSLFYLCYNGIRQYSLVEYNNAIGLNNNAEIEAKRPVSTLKNKDSDKYKSSSLSIEEMESIFKQIKELFEIEKIYLEPQLKIQDLSDSINVTTHNISQTINSKAQQSFYDFVNKYRAEHFKTLLANPDNRKFTILALGIESGFNSKATLNRIFKKQVGVSPKEFQKSHFIA